MTKRGIASLTIKLMGVFILLKSIGYFPMSLGGLYYAFQESQESILRILLLVLMIVGMAGISLGFSILVIIFSDRIAARLIKDDGLAEMAANPMSKSDVMAIAISCIGLYFIVAAVPTLISGLINVALYMNRSIPSMRYTIIRTLVIPAVQIGLGIWLFAGSKGIVKLWKKIRS
jgi:hypothetical protein